MEYTLNSAVVAILIAFSVNIVLCPFFIPFLKRVKFGQNIRTDGPNSHLKKAGTPTMGGIVILISFLISSFPFVMGNFDAGLVVFTAVAFGAIGFADDYIKVVMKRSLGLRAYQKILSQSVVAAVFLFFFISRNPDYGVMYIPFYGGTLDLRFLAAPFLFFVIIAVVNGVNLTDGLDGLASGVTALISTFLIFISWALGSGVLPIAGAVTGSLLGFLLFNAYPAKVFMGDTGSLALGGFVVSAAIILRIPLFIPIIGFIYFMESVSVIIQVLYFKATKGKRFFLMAPLHHHFELKGMEESRVVMAFYIVTAILCLLGYLATSGMF